MYVYTYICICTHICIFLHVLLLSPSLSQSLSMYQEILTWLATQSLSLSLSHTHTSVALALAATPHVVATPHADHTRSAQEGDKEKNGGDTGGQFAALETEQATSATRGGVSGGPGGTAQHAPAAGYNSQHSDE